MLPPVHIPAQPSSQDCLAWSPDGELAVAAGEQVYLLIPQYGGLEPWTHLHITVSSFTFAEWPWQEPASFRDMSIGEEQARATVTALAWSPAGLAKHRRPVLAVLTSNLILSLWTSNASPTDANSWERIVVINKALQTGSRLQQRIRSMAWAPTNPQHVERQTPFSRRKWGIPLIAVADDNNGLHVLKVSSPFPGPTSDWIVEVLHRHSVPVSTSSNGLPSLLNDILSASHYVGRIEFGRWKGDIPLMYSSSGTIHHARLSVHEDLPPRVGDSDSLIVSLDQVHARDNDMPSQVTVTPPIKAQMAAEKEKFGLDNRLGSQVTLRRWGLAASHNLVAACITLHPAKMIEYIAPFDGTATILFDAGNESGDPKSLFPWQSPAQVDVAKTQRAILDTLLDRKLHKYLVLNDFDLKILYTAFCGTILLSVNDRLQRIQAAVDILELMEQHASIDLDAEHSALEAIKASRQFDNQELINVTGQMTTARGQAISSLGQPEKFLVDLCPFCPETHTVIPFDSFAEAYCPQGHSFGTPFPFYLTCLHLTSVQGGARLPSSRCWSQEAVNAVWTANASSSMKGLIPKYKWNCPNGWVLSTLTTAVMAILTLCRRVQDFPSIRSPLYCLIRSILALTAVASSSIE